MKKLFMLIMSAVFAISANAQKLEGTYIASDEFHELMNSFVEDDNVEVGFGVFFNGNDIDLIIAVSAEAEGMEVNCSITYNGKYVRTGNQFKCNFNKDEASFVLNSMKSDDPEIKKALEDDETKDLLYKMVEEMMEESMKSSIEGMSSVCDFFSSFYINSQTEEGFNMLISQDGEELEIGFSKL